MIPTIGQRGEILNFPSGFLQIKAMLSVEEMDILEDNRVSGNTFPDEVMAHVKCVLCCCYGQDSPVVGYQAHGRLVEACPV